MYVFDQRMTVDGLDSFSPSASKPQRYVDALLHRNRWEAQHCAAGVLPVSIDDLKRVHDPDYVDAVFAGTVNNGFENRDPRVPQACLWTVGSLVSAAEHAVQDPVRPVCSPSSGFHHAGYDYGGGFCTFNGLLVAAQLYLDKHPGHKVGIIDCDVHYGDGTDHILKRKPQLADHVVHRTSGKHFHEDADRFEFFHWLRESIDVVNEQGCQLVLYQAGADMHKDDPLGGFLDDADMALRDRQVFEGVHGAIAWNLAGGYREKVRGVDPVIETHLRTHLAAIQSAVVRGRRLRAVSQPAK